MKFLASSIMQGRMQAILVACVSALLSLIFLPLSIVSSAAVALVTLRRGATEGLYVLVSASLASAVLGAVLIRSYEFSVLYGLTVWIPVWFTSFILREGRHFFLAIEVISIIACLAVLGAYLYQPQLAAFWHSMLNDWLEEMITKSKPDLALKDIRQSLSVFYHFIITGLVAVSYVSSTLAGLFLGRWWQAILYNPGGFKKEYLASRGQPSLAIASLVVVALAWLTSGWLSEVCANISIILTVLYAFLGTTVLHTVFANLQMSRLTVPFLYITLLLVPHLVIPVAIIGLTDTWLNLRNKTSTKSA